MLSVHCQAAETNNDEKQPQTIRVGSFEDTFNYVGKNGVRQGYGYELMQALAGYTGWKFEYVKCDWSNCFDKLENGEIDIMGLLVASGLCASRSEARRAVQQGGVAVNGEKVGSIEASYKPEDINKEDFVLRRGKKNYRKIIFE